MANRTPTPSTGQLTVGAVTFLSEVCAGRASDVQISNESGLISNRIRWTSVQIQADRGFTLAVEFGVTGNATLHIPTFIQGNSKLSQVETEDTQKIEHIRITWSELAPDNIKGDLFDDAYIVDLDAFCQAMQMPRT